MFVLDMTSSPMRPRTGQRDHVDDGVVLAADRAGNDSGSLQGRCGADHRIIAGHVTAGFLNLSDVVPHAASGAIRPLAVSAKKRVPQLPDVPTVIESGVPGFKAVTWNGLMAPAERPKDIVDRMRRRFHGPCRTGASSSASAGMASSRSATRPKNSQP